MSFTWRTGWRAMGLLAESRTCDANVRAHVRAPRRQRLLASCILASSTTSSPPVEYLHAVQHSPVLSALPLRSARRKGRRTRAWL